MPDPTPRHGFGQYAEDEDWDYNSDFELLDELVNGRGPFAERPAEGDYPNEMYEAIDQRIVYRWDSTANDWEAFMGRGTDTSPLPGTTYREKVRLDEAQFADADRIVSPTTHDFDAIIDELNDGHHVVAIPGTYDASPELPDVTGGSLTFLDGARVDVPDDPAAGWLNIQGQSHAQSTVVTADLSEGDRSIPVDDATLFEAGQPALLNDDGGYETMAGRGEIVYVSNVDTANDTISTLDLLGLDHSPVSNGDTVELVPMDPLTDENNWTGVTFDCRGVEQTNWPLVTRHHVDGHVMRDITFINGNGSSMHQYMEVRESYAPKLVDSRNGRVNDGDLGLMWSPERQTRHAVMRDCTVYWGNVAEFGNNGSGPSQDPRFENVTVVGGAFSSNATVIRPHYSNCHVSSNEDDADDDAAFLSDGVEARFVNCTAEGSFTGFELRGYNERVIDCEVRRPNAAAVRFGSGGGGHSDAHTGTKRIRGLEVYDSQSSTIASIGDPGDAVISNLTAENSGDLLNLAGGPPLVVVDGAEVRGGTGISTSGISRIELKNLDVDGQGLSSDWFRETSADVFDHLVVEDSSFYNIGQSVFRLENYGTLEMNNCRVPQGETEVGHYLLRDEGNGGQVILRGNDARNTGLSDGYELLSEGRITDGTNLASGGGVF